MKIKSNALAQELDSPYYIANKQFCQDFERYVASKKGFVKGTYNAWSYVIYGKIETTTIWNIKYKKAAYTGNGNLLLSSKFQNLLELAKWSCTIHEHCTIFIRKKRMSDRLNPSYHKIEEFPKYVKKVKGKPSLYFEKVLDILAPLFTSNKVYRISLKHQKLTIELRSDELHTDILDQLLQLS